MKTVRQALQLLKLFTPAAPRWSVTQAAEQLGLTKSTASRLLAALAREGFLTRDSPRGPYAVGQRAYAVGVVYLLGLDVRQAALPVLEEVAFNLRETVYLGALGDGAAVYIDKILSPLALRVDSYLGVSVPLHATALGKALLAWQPQEYVEGVMSRGLQPLTAQTITDPAVLRRELERIRVEGYATDFEEYEEGLHCVGLPIRDASGNVPWAFSVAGPSIRLTREVIQANGPRLRLVAEQISQRLGAGQGMVAARAVAASQARAEGLIARRGSP